ncbi:hypothetical protein [Paenibacillus anseongensis]|nr:MULTISPECIES: hypothetical protein [Paenibacillus]
MTLDNRAAIALDIAVLLDLVQCNEQFRGAKGVFIGFRPMRLHSF